MKYGQWFIIGALLVLGGLVMYHVVWPLLRGG